ncbi:acetyltransferase [Planococcus sp. CPCC 101016]|uniref:acetyltransferase n=1 Tax=Planococcus sp. CPCC 101016 TaxID=2599617 RepID=UPI0011B359DF|nr:acetyltransferase [Planococcus sp. CPCC 101016]TWT07036.1 acetyltransferase [Planococcus sp. CPCC 101016]
MNKVEKEKLLIIGASGHGKVVADIAFKMNKWQRIAFLDDDETLKKSLSLDVIGNSKDLKTYVDEWDIFVAIGSNSTREKIQEALNDLAATIPVLIHPQAVIGEEVEIAKGTVVMGGVIINSSTKIGRGCIINTGSTIDHDNFIEDFVHISPGVHLAGTVKVGSRCWLGIGSIVSNNISLHRDSKIGAGAVMVKDTIESGLYIGVPARRA